MRVAQRAAGQPSRYDGLCRSYSPDEVARREAAGEPYVIRMVVPDEGTCVVEDLRRGPIEFDYRSVDMQVLVKSDGLPTYHLANVVDDHLMRITHVFRGEEWVSSAPKHLLLYSYFGWEPPKLMHLPLLRNPDKSKLSKRKNPTGILFYRAMGYLPEALINFLALLANATRDGEDELLDLPAIVKRFEVEHVPVGGPVFDVAKLDWLNARYIRERHDAESLLERVREWAASPQRLTRIAQLAAPRIERLSDLGPLLAFLFSGRIALRAESLQSKKLDDDQTRQAFSLGARGARRAARVECVRDSDGARADRRIAWKENARRSRARSTSRSPEARPRFRSTIRWSCSAGTSFANACATRSSS